MTALPAVKFGQNARAIGKAFVFVIGITSAIVVLPSAIASEDLVALSDFFAIKKVSGGIGAYKWEGTEIYVRAPGKEPEYLGSSEAGQPTGMGQLSDAAKHLRAVTMAVSKDGRSLVFRQSARDAGSRTKPEPGIHQYVYGTGIKIVHSEQELSGLSYTRYEKTFPEDVLPFKYKITYTPKDLSWAVTASGEQLPLALLEATPLHWAAFEGRTEECTALIKSGADINAKTYWDFTAVELAVIRDQQDTAIQLLALGADPNAGTYPAFHLAVMLARMKVFQTMIDRGANVNATDRGGLTPLHVAVPVGTRLAGAWSTFFNNAETSRSILDKNVTTTLVQTLLDKGADPGIRDKSNRTPLDAVSTIAPPQVKELLIARSRAR